MNCVWLPASMLLAAMVLAFTASARTHAEQLAVLRAYLLHNHGRANVNQAEARKLSPVLDVAADVAEAVVKYRTDNGGFKTIEDLKRVPGLDPARVDARKDRLIF